jgi:hypothetical protein
MVNILIYFVTSNVADFHPIPSIYFLVAMLIEVNNLWNQSVFCSPTKFVDFSHNIDCIDLFHFC